MLLMICCACRPLPLAFLMGTAVNQDGRSSSLTAPNGPAQQAVLRMALAKGSCSPLMVSALEMHGTGTPLGDPIEMGAAAAVLSSASKPSASGPGQGLAPELDGMHGAFNLVLAAVKSAVGHGEPAAGVSALAHALLQTQQAAAQPILHLRGVNPHLSAIMKQGHGARGWMAPRQLAGLPSQAPTLEHIAGISAFAFQVGHALQKMHLCIAIAPQ